jgi:hypothetical protein
MVLLDWMRMGKQYCLAGVVQQGGQLRIVRPLLAAQQVAPVRNIGWSPYLMDGHSPWEIFDLSVPELEGRSWFRLFADRLDTAPLLCLRSGDLDGQRRRSAMGRRPVRCPGMRARRMRCDSLS